MLRFDLPRASSRTKCALRGRECCRSLACGALAVQLAVGLDERHEAAFYGAPSNLMRLMWAPGLGES
jgi:hypothetical protein